jgi:hypothetical protein
MYSPLEKERINQEMVETVLLKLEPKIKDAAINALDIGYGFIVLKRNSSSFHEIDVRHMLWPEVERVLRDMGALGFVKGPRD